MNLVIKILLTASLFIIAIFLFLVITEIYNRIKLEQQASQDPDTAMLAVLNSYDKKVATVGASQDFNLVSKLINKSKLWENIATKAIKNGANPNIETAVGTSPLGWAISNNLNDISTLLIQKGAHVNGHGAYSDSQHFTPPLFWAIHSRNIQGVKILIDNGADIMIPLNDQDYDALKTAITTGSVDIVKILLANHANPNAISKLGSSPLHLAVNSGLASDSAADRNQIVTLLLDNGANINYQNARDKETALFSTLYAFTYQEESWQSTIALLLERGVDVHIKNKDGKTAYEKALELGKTKEARLIKTHIDKK